MTTAKPGIEESENLKDSLSALAEAARAESRVTEPGEWTLPSGEGLVQYALKGGFLAPGILGSTGGHTQRSHAAKVVGATKVERDEEGLMQNGRIREEVR